MFTLQTKLVLGALLLALIGGLITVQHFTQRKLVAAKAELRTANATLVAEREARAHELKIAKDASSDYQTRLAKLEADKPAIPVRTVRLCHANPTVPATPGTSSGTDAGASSEQPSTAGPDLEAGPDIGPNLYALADEADQRASQCNALIGWIRSAGPNPATRTISHFGAL